MSLICCRLQRWLCSRLHEETQPNGLSKGFRGFARARSGIPVSPFKVKRRMICWCETPMAREQTGRRCSILLIGITAIVASAQDCSVTNHTTAFDFEPFPMPVIGSVLVKHCFNEDCSEFNYAWQCQEVGIGASELYPGACWVGLFGPGQPRLGDYWLQPQVVDRCDWCNSQNFTYTVAWAGQLVTRRPVEIRVSWACDGGGGGPEILNWSGLEQPQTEWEWCWNSFGDQVSNVGRIILPSPGV